MAKGIFPVKRLATIGEVETTHNTAIDAAFDEIKERINSAKQRLVTGCIDAPVYEDAIYLGRISDAEQLIVKVNVPGWIYRFSPVADITATAAAGYGKEYARGKTGILLASDPVHLLDNTDTAKSNRIMYMTAWDGIACSNANAMFPILPGQNTYMLVTHDTSVVNGADADKEFYFIPTLGATCMNIHPDDYVTVVGSTTVDVELSDAQETFVGNPIVNSIFTKSWNSTDSNGHLNNFASIYGWMRVRRDQVKFACADATKLKKYQDDFNKSHPAAQLQNLAVPTLGEDEVIRYGMVCCVYNYEPGDHINAVAATPHSAEPWLDTTLGALRRSILQSAEAIAGQQGKLSSTATHSDGLVFRSGTAKSKVGYFFRLWVVAGNTYTIGGLPIYTSTYTTHSISIRIGETHNKKERTASSFSYTATETGFVDCSFVYALSEGKTGGLSVTITEKKGSTVVTKAAAINSNLWEKRIALPSKVTYAQFKAWNRFLSIRQVLVKA